MAKKDYRDPLGAHVRLYHYLVKSHAFRALSPSARCLYIDLRLQLRATNNGDISAAKTDLEKLGWTSSATISRALKELVAAGFIAVTRPGGFPARTPTLYRFTDLDTYERRDKGIPAVKATNDFQKFQSVEQARAAIERRVREMTDRNRGRQWKKFKVRLMNAVGFCN